MQHPITKDTIRFTLTERFDYLKAGEVYRGTPYRSSKGARIDRDDESAGTSLRGYQWRMLLAGTAGFTIVEGD